MSWITTIEKPHKSCVENSEYPLFWLFAGHDWKLSGATKQIGIIAAAMICGFDCKTVVEIGLWQGFSSKLLGKALTTNVGKDGLLVSIDIKQSNADKSRRQTKNLPITHRVVVADSKDIRMKGLLEGRPIDLAFIDGDHSYEYAKNDMTICDKWLRPYGIMIVHDYSNNGFPGVYKAVNEFVADKDYAMFYLPENRKTVDYRTAILQKRS